MSFSLCVQSVLYNHENEGKNIPLRFCQSKNDHFQNLPSPAELNELLYDNCEYYGGDHYWMCDEDLAYAFIYKETLFKRERKISDLFL